MLCCCWSLQFTTIIFSYVRVILSIFERNNVGNEFKCLTHCVVFNVWKLTWKHKTGCSSCHLFLITTWRVIWHNTHIISSIIVNYYYLHECSLCLVSFDSSWWFFMFERQFTTNITTRRFHLKQKQFQHSIKTANLAKVLKEFESCYCLLWKNKMMEEKFRNIVTVVWWRL